MRNHESDKLTIAIYAHDIEPLRDLVQSRPYDFGCRAHVRRLPDDKFMTAALVTRDQYDDLLQEKYEVDILFDRISDDRRAEVTVGRGDRFGGGSRAPQGVGSGGTDDAGGIMNVDEIGSAMTGLVNEYGIPTFSVPNSTSEGSGGKGGSVWGDQSR